MLKSLRAGAGLAGKGLAALLAGRGLAGAGLAGRRLAGASLIALLAGTAQAGDVALVISNASYVSASDDPRIGAAHAAQVAAWQRAGYVVVEGLNADRAAMRRLLAEFEAEAGTSGRMAVQFTGHAPSVGRTVYLAPVDVLPSSPGGMALDSVPLDLILALAGKRPGQSAVFLGLMADDLAASDKVRPAPGDPVPQGVFLAFGTPEVVAREVAENFLTPGRSVSAAAAVAKDLRLRGFVSGLTVLAGAAASVPPPGTGGDLVEDALWAIARQNPTAANLRAYLDRYPAGRYVPEARRLLAGLVPPPPAIDPAEAAEIALNLGRDQRRRVQENLTVLGYDTRGVDGIFGPGTRAAIRAWQGDSGLVRSGFLDRRQLDRLSAAAEARADQIAAEEAARKREEELADARFWQATGASGRAADLRTYLERYPEGIYAREARRALDRIEADERDAAEAADRADWDRAVAVNTIPAYRRYLDQRPRGVFADAARARIRVLEAEGGGDTGALARIENGLGLNNASMALIEQRLKMLDYDTGLVDGRLDEQSRRAIRQFQRRQGLEVTGYLNPVTIQRLIVASSGG
jgi:peptidoglycan hydrolase-like protein with peptidoglycan-binding domain